MIQITMAAVLFLQNVQSSNEDWSDIKLRLKTGRTGTKASGDYFRLLVKVMNQAIISRPK